MSPPSMNIRMEFKVCIKTCTRVRARNVQINALCTPSDFISLLHGDIYRCEWFHATWSIVKVTPLQRTLDDGDSKVEIGERRN